MERGIGKDKVAARRLEREYTRYVIVRIYRQGKGRKREGDKDTRGQTDGRRGERCGGGGHVLAGRWVDQDETKTTSR